MPPRGGRNLPYSIDLMYRPYNSVSTNVLYTVILNERHLGQRDLQNTKHVSHHTVKSNVGSVSKASKVPELQA